MKNDNDFEYKYSAPSSEERKEIERIRNKYINSESDSKLNELKALDKKVKNIPKIFSITCGVIGVLIFGLGLAFILEFSIIVWGVVVGLLGILIMCLAYPIAIHLSKHLKNKYSSEILRLSDELLNSKDEKNEHMRFN